MKPSEKRRNYRNERKGTENYILHVFNLFANVSSSFLAQYEAQLSIIHTNSVDVTLAHFNRGKVTVSRCDPCVFL